MSEVIRLLRIENIVGMQYKNERPTDTVVIYGLGAPIPPDIGTLPDAPVLMEKPVDVFVPDYIGYGRSDGVFTPMGCIQTFLQLYDQLTQGCDARNSYHGVSTRLQYDRIIFIGRSFGGTYVPVLPRFNPRIRELAIFCPVVDSKNCGAVLGEETNEQFLRSMKEDGYHHLYRGVVDPVWADHLENRDDLSPMDNIEYLSDAKLFIGHGMKDTCVHFSHSVDYHRRILKQFPDKKGQYKIVLYKEGGHDRTTTNLASRDFLDWLGI